MFPEQDGVVAQFWRGRSMAEVPTVIATADGNCRLEPLF